MVGEEGKQRLIQKATNDPLFVHTAVRLAMADPELLSILCSGAVAEELLLDARAQR